MGRGILVHHQPLWQASKHSTERKKNSFFGDPKGCLTPPPPPPRTHLTGMYINYWKPIGWSSIQVYSLYTKFTVIFELSFEVYMHVMIGSFSANCPAFYRFVLIFCLYFHSKCPPRCTIIIETFLVPVMNFVLQNFVCEWREYFYWMIINNSAWLMNDERYKTAPTNILFWKIVNSISYSVLSLTCKNFLSSRQGGWCSYIHL